MKKAVSITEVAGEGLIKFIGERLTLFCANYIYTGVLVGVDETCVCLESASIVYETGAFNEKAWKDAQAMPGAWYVQLGAIESFGLLK